MLLIANVTTAETVKLNEQSKLSKTLLQDAADPYIAMLNYRNSAIANGFSPAELSMSRTLRSKISILTRNIQPHTINKDMLVGIYLLADNFNWRHNAKSSPELSIGDEIWIPDWKESAVIVNSPHPRSVVAATPSKTYRRIQQMLRHSRRWKFLRMRKMQWRNHIRIQEPNINVDMADWLKSQADSKTNYAKYLICDFD